MTKIFPLLHIKEEMRKKEVFMGISPLFRVSGG